MTRSVGRTDAPLPLCRVLEEEFISIHGGEVDPYVWSITADDISDVQTLIADLQTAWHADGSLRTAFARTAQAVGRDAPATDVKDAAAAELTALLDKPDQIDRLARVLEGSVDARIEKWREMKPAGDDLLHLNRLRLESLFHRSLTKIYDRRLEALYGKIDKSEQAALCLSGGGIRSATFALGVLQGLAHHNLLNNFHYLSTVSGGGYIGSWLSSWISHHRNGIQGVSQELLQRGESKLEPEPAPIHHLRSYSNYLTPQLGLFSGDTWALVGTYARNVTMNLNVLVPLLFALILLPRIFVATVRDVAHHPDVARWLPWAAALLGTFAIKHLTLRRPSVERIDSARAPSKYSRWLQGQRSFFLLSLLPLFACSLLLTLYWSYAAHAGVEFSIWEFAIFGLLMQAGGFLGIRRFQGDRLYVELALFTVSGLIGGAMLFFVAALFPAKNTLLLASFGPPLFLLNFLGAATVYVAAISSTRFSFDEDLEWWARTGGWTLLFAGVWAAACSLVIYGPLAVLQAPEWWTAGAGTVAVATVAVLRSLRNAFSRGATGDKKTTILNMALSWLAPACAIALFCALSFVASWFFTLKSDAVNFRSYSAGSVKAPTIWLTNEEAKAMHRQAVETAALSHLVFACVGLIAAGLFFSWIVDINTFSMHSMYRNRLTRAYLGASRDRRRPNPFTGFDPADSREMHELGPECFDAHSFHDFLALTDAFSGPANNALSGRFPSEVQKLLRRIEQIEPHCRRALRARRTTEPVHPELARRFVRVLNQLIRDRELRMILAGKPAAESGPILHRANRRRLEKAFPRWIVPIEYTTAFTTDTIVDTAAFMRDLDPAAGNALAKVLWPRLSPVSRNSIKAGAAARMEDAREALARDLNAVLYGRSLYFQALRGHDLDAVIISLAESQPAGGDVVILNRLILEHAFPRTMRRWRSGRPFHVVNTALNLVQGEDLAWQERKAESFTMTPLHAGAARLGFRSSHSYGDSFGFSLPTAVTISGAAASPSMGYQTSTTLALLMTLFNVRLGWWLGNPGPWGARTYRRSSPRWSLKPILQEALGLTNDTRAYVYLSDGGHFENLGLYEMVRRRCKTIVVSDAGQDYRHAFQDLGNAVRKIRVDLGVPIEIKERKIFAKEEHKLGKYCAVGDILYSEVDKGATNGKLIYLKPAFYGAEPMDVYNYARENVEFPHEPTSDQFFAESQFESYRMLGQHTIDAICDQREWQAQSLRDFATRALDYLRKDEPAPPAGRERPANAG